MPSAVAPGTPPDPLASDSELGGVDMISNRIVWLSLTGFLALPATLGAGTSFTLIADTSGRLQSLGLFPSINDAGTVGFNGSPELGTAGVYVGSGGGGVDDRRIPGPGLQHQQRQPALDQRRR